MKDDEGFVCILYLSYMKSTLKERGYEAEQLVVDDYVRRGYVLLEQNWTMRGGEIDAIFRDEGSDELIFVEVKLITAMVGDTIGYVTPAKLRHLQRAIRRYLVEYPLLHERYSVRIDVVFVDESGIVERYEDIYL